MQSLDLRGVTYRIGDYAYFRPSLSEVTQYQIGRITRISRVPPKLSDDTVSASSSFTAPKQKILDCGTSDINFSSIEEPIDSSPGKALDSESQTNNLPRPVNQESVSTETRVGSGESCDAGIAESTHREATESGGQVVEREQSGSSVSPTAGIPSEAIIASQGVVTEASAKENEQGEIQVRLSLYWRPSEAKP
ncbi:unnamed protein product, partial [Protopolystoma xenopodis]